VPVGCGLTFIRFANIVFHSMFWCIYYYLKFCGSRRAGTSSRCC
jgi:hypothetical protein